MKKAVLLVFLALAIVGMAGCTKTFSGQNDGVGIRGEITKLSKNNEEKIVGILVEGKVESDTTHDKAMVTIDSGTKIMKSGSNEKLTVEALKEGVKVEVVFTGPVAESYPVQAKAAIVRIL